ncbi:MAG: YtoQ family protein [Flavobacteriales bacterium]|nr:YtoQ family protein [Flavobacteriales bacterium]
MKVFLSGEIHSNWREEIYAAVEASNLPYTLLQPNCDHDSSDDVGVFILGAEENNFWKDNKAAKINNIRIRTNLNASDIVIVKFGEKYRQWNAAFDAGYAIAKGKILIVIHPEEFTHALKEVDAQASAVCHTTEQAIAILEYNITSEL